MPPQGPTPADALEYMTRQRIMPAAAFNPGFTLGGHQPFVMIPRASGDVVQVRTHLSHKLTYTVRAPYSYAKADLIVSLLDSSAGSAAVQYPGGPGLQLRVGRRSRLSIRQ